MSQPTDGTNGHAGTTAQPVCLLTRFSAVDDAAARGLAEALRGTAASVVTEPGHLTYDVLVDQADPTTLYVVETWASAEDAHRHEERVVTDGGVERVAPLLAEELTTMTLRPLQPVDDEDGEHA